MRGQDLVSVCEQSLAEGAAGRNTATVAANGAGEIDLHFFSRSRTRSTGIAVAVPKRDVTVVAWNSEL